jgi:hypothetical protein
VGPKGDLEAVAKKNPIICLSRELNAGRPASRLVSIPIRLPRFLIDTKQRAKL